MVKICSESYPKNKNTELFEKYSFELSSFQKHAIEGIVEGKHVLITAHTGSGKTMPAEFAIEHFVAKGKKVIYTGPIKALINQKFYDFTLKFPHITFGILTGDIKCNPEAQVLIVTAEILLNKLYQVNSKSNVPPSAVSFEMDIENELGCVVMDEVHYINDPDRGHVWENTIMMLPKHVQMVMLSASIDQPEKFAHWVETTESKATESKEVYLTSTNERVVPLTHYSFLTTGSTAFKNIKDKALQAEINAIINKPLVIQTPNGVFDEVQFGKISKVIHLFEKNDIRVRRQHVINQLLKHCVEHEMLPALFFVFSRKQLEICAEEVTANLLEFDSKVPYTIDRECEQIIRKLPNYQESLHLPEYVNMVKLLRKGVAIHHSGITPVLREMVELLYSKGYIKVLFATETFAVGINMPTKSVVFTDVNKFDGNSSRMLLGHEYTQMSGRAGRRNIDKVGHVIHLNNLFRDFSAANYRTMMKGRPQLLTSKFKISYNLLLSLVDIGDNNFVGFSKRSMVTSDIDNELGELFEKISKATAEVDTMKISTRTPQLAIEEYLDLSNQKQMASNKKRKDLDRQMQSIADQYKFFEQDKSTIQKMINKRIEIDMLQRQFESTEKYIDNNVMAIIKLLINDGFISNDDEQYKLTKLGTMAKHLRETHCLVFARLLNADQIYALDAIQLVGLLSCLTNVVVSDDCKDSIPKTTDKQLKSMIDVMGGLYNEYQDKEVFATGVDYNIQYDLIDYAMRWCSCENEVECKLVLQDISSHKNVFLGEFVKALLKINNIATELEKIAEDTQNITFLSKLKEIPTMILKYVVTNQSLYV
jgi:superfamily II RNA helicase